MADSPLNTVQVTIRRTPTGIAVQGFGTGIILAKNPPWGAGMRVFTSASEAITAGVVSGSVLHRMISDYFSGPETRPERVRVWGFVSAVACGLQLKVASVPAVGTIVTVDIVLPNGTVCTGTYTVAAGNVATDIAAGLHASIDPQAGIASAFTIGADVLALTADTTTERLRVRAAHECLEFLDTEGDLNLPAQLNAVGAITTDFYGILHESTSKANIEAVAGWVQANGRIHFALCIDSWEYNLAGGAGTTGASLKASGIERTDFRVKRYSEKRADAFFAGIILSQTWDTGTAPDWAFRTMPGIDADAWNATQRANLDANNASYYIPDHGYSVTWEGKTPSGGYGDFMVFIDWVSARVRESLFRILVSERRLTYSPDDIGKVKDGISKVLVLAQARKAIPVGEKPTVTAPAPAQIPTETRATHVLPDVRFSCVFASGIHRINVEGTVIL